MTHPTYTDSFLRARKFYLVLPLLALPFLTFIYWKLVVKNLHKNPADQHHSPGLQLSLPPADLKGDQNMDKLAYYRKADQDSANWMQQIKKDPYRQDEYAAAIDSTNSVLMGLAAPDSKSKRTQPISINSKGQTRHERQVHRRLHELNKALTSVQEPAFENEPGTQIKSAGRPPIEKLEKMMADMQGENLTGTQDPEMAQLDAMLDKLLELQQQERHGAALPANAESNQSRGLPVSPVTNDSQVTLLAADSDSSVTEVTYTVQASFYGLDDNLPPAPPGLTAIIERTQELVSGSTVQLRLTSPLSVSGSAVSENTFIYGIASLSGERLKIKISSLRSGEQILPVSLSVYDLDGIEGIYIPGALSRTIAKQQLGSQVQGYDLDIDGFSAGAQTASAGLQMGKMLLSRKTRLTQVTLNQGYRVLLYDTNTKNQ